MALHLHRDDKAVEFSVEKLREMARCGELAQDEYVYDDEKGEWIGAALVPQLEGAWQLEESEATVAMELPADFFDQFDAEEKAAEASVDVVESQASEPSVVVAASAPSAGPPPGPPEDLDDSEDLDNSEEATRALDLADFEGALAPSTMKQEESTVAIEAPFEHEPAAPLKAPTRPPARKSPRAAKRPGRGGAAAGDRSVGKLVNPIVAALLCFPTCFIYLFVWMYLRGQEVNEFLGREAIPRWIVPAIIGVSLVSGPLGPFALGVFYAYKLGEAVEEMSEQSGLAIGERKVIYAVSHTALFFLVPVLPFLGQQDLNEIWKANGAMTN